MCDLVTLWSCYNSVVASWIASPTPTPAATVATATPDTTESMAISCRTPEAKLNRIFYRTIKLLQKYNGNYEETTEYISYCKETTDNHYIYRMIEHSKKLSNFD